MEDHVEAIKQSRYQLGERVVLFDSVGVSETCRSFLAQTYGYCLKFLSDLHDMDIQLSIVPRYIESQKDHDTRLANLQRRKIPLHAKDRERHIVSGSTCFSTRSQKLEIILSTEEAKYKSKETKYVQDYDVFLCKTFGHEVWEYCYVRSSQHQQSMTRPLEQTLNEYYKDPVEGMANRFGDLIWEACAFGLPSVSDQLDFYRIGN